MSHVFNDYFSINTKLCVFYIIGLVTNNNHNNNLYSCGIDCSLDGGGTNCTCSDVASMINDISSARSEAYTQATAYSTYSQEVVSSLAAYATARSAYDAEYITNKTAGTKVYCSGSSSSAFIQDVFFVVIVMCLQFLFFVVSFQTTPVIFII
jgi:hypothetical protein